MQSEQRERQHAHRDDGGDAESLRDRERIARQGHPQRQLGDDERHEIRKDQARDHESGTAADLQPEELRVLARQTRRRAALAIAIQATLLLQRLDDGLRVAGAELAQDHSELTAGLRLQREGVPQLLGRDVPLTEQYLPDLVASTASPAIESGDALPLA